MDLIIRIAWQTAFFLIFIGLNILLYSMRCYINGNLTYNFQKARPFYE